jgi:hypothetical protein
MLGRVSYKSAVFVQPSKQAKSAPGKLKICRFVHFPHLGALGAERDDFSTGGGGIRSVGEGPGAKWTFRVASGLRITRTGGSDITAQEMSDKGQ